MANRKRGVSYVQQGEPSFITQFKQKVGYKEGPTIDSKRAELERDDSDGEEREDDLPTIVALRKGDLTLEEVERLRQADPDLLKTTTETEEKEAEDGKIRFRKPVKRAGESSELKVTSKKKKDEEKAKELEDKLKTSNGKGRVKNCSLLSFDDEEEEDE